MRYVVIRDGIVENIILWDGQSDRTPPEGTTVEQSDTLQIGDAVE
jgi:hypothetical protein